MCLLEFEDKNEDGVIMFFLVIINLLVFLLFGIGKEIFIFDGYFFLDLEFDDVVEIFGVKFLRGGEIDEYIIVKRDQIVIFSFFIVFIVDYFDVLDGVIVVKVLKIWINVLFNNEVVIVKNVI